MKLLAARTMGSLHNVKTAVLFLSSFFLVILASNWTDAKENTVKIGVNSGNAKITLLEGRAHRIKTGQQESKPLSENDLLSQGDLIYTEKNSKIEIRLPDNSYLRFGELTRLKLEAASLDEKNRKRYIWVKMLFGKVWAKVSKLFSGRGRFAISTRTAVAGVRGTVYRMNVNKDNSAEVKVYYGEVLVSSLSESKKKADAIQKLEKPKAVSGPKPIPGPRAVTGKEWTHIVRSMQQIIIKPDGTATKPFRFSALADENEWVRWNRERDKEKKDR